MIQKLMANARKAIDNINAKNNQKEMKKAMKKDMKAASGKNKPEKAVSEVSDLFDIEKG